MNKADMRKGMLLKEKIGAEERIYRVLDLKEKVLVLDCVKKTMPVWKTYTMLISKDWMLLIMGWHNIEKKKRLSLVVTDGAVVHNKEKFLYVVTVFLNNSDGIYFLFRSCFYFME